MGCGASSPSSASEQEEKARRYCEKQQKVDEMKIKKTSGLSGSDKDRPPVTPCGITPEDPDSECSEEERVLDAPPPINTTSNVSPVTVPSPSPATTAAHPADPSDVDSLALVRKWEIGRAPSIAWTTCEPNSLMEAIQFKIRVIKARFQHGVTDDVDQYVEEIAESVPLFRSKDKRRICEWLDSLDTYMPFVPLEDQSELVSRAYFAEVEKAKYRIQSEQNSTNEGGLVELVDTEAEPKSTKTLNAENGFLGASKTSAIGMSICSMAATDNSQTKEFGLSRSMLSTAAESVVQKISLGTAAPSCAATSTVPIPELIVPSNAPPARNEGAAPLGVMVA